jgi:hypothetical protein
MPAYRWSCLACGAANAPTSEHCENCGCSVRPNYAEIQSAKKAGGVVDPVDGPTLAELAACFKAHLTGKPGGSGFFAAAFGEIFWSAIFFLLLLAVFQACRKLGLL